MIKTKRNHWCEKLFDELDFESVWPTNLQLPARWDNCPKWLINVSRELIQQSMPSTPIRRVEHITPHRLGSFLGQHCANLYAIGDILQAGAKHLANEKTV